jgi:hypothetical protein
MIVREKIKVLRKNLSDRFGTEVAQKSIKAITTSLKQLSDHLNDLDVSIRQNFYDRLMAILIRSILPIDFRLSEILRLVRNSVKALFSLLKTARPKSSRHSPKFSIVFL